MSDASCFQSGVSRGLRIASHAELVVDHFPVFRQKNAAERQRFDGKASTEAAIHAASVTKSSQPRTITTQGSEKRK